MLKLSCSLIFTIVSPYLACKLSPLYKWQTQVLSGGSKTCVTSISSKTHGGFPIVSQKKNSLCKCWKRSFISKAQWHFAVSDNYRRTHYTEPFRQLFMLSWSGLGASNFCVDSGKSVLHSSCSKTFCSISDSMCIALLDYSSPAPSHLLFNRPRWMFI